MPENLFESNPARYRELSQPFPNGKAAGDAMQAFRDDVLAARIKHKIADVLIVMAVNGMSEDGKTEGRAMISSSMGSVHEEEAMAAYALGRAQMERQERIAELVGQAIQRLKKQK